MAQPRDDWDRKFSKSDRLSKEDVQKLKDAFDRGVNYRDAARSIGCSSRTVCKRFAILRGNPHQKAKYIPKAKLVRRPIEMAPPKPTSRFYKGSFEL